MDRDMKIYQLSSLSALPFWFPPFYASYVRRGFVLDKVVPSKLTFSVFMKSFGLTAVYQPLFPFVGALSSLLHKSLFGFSFDKDNLWQRTLSLGIVSASTAIVVNPFEVKMLALRSGLCVGSFSKYFSGVTALALRNVLVGTNLFIAYPELKKRFDVNSQSPISSAVICVVPATITTLMLMPLDVTCAMFQKNANENKREVWKQLKNSGIRTFFAGTKWRIVATTIETYLFNEFQEHYRESLR